MEVDDIDAETLQAQIDMSMSLVQSLVSSWVKPSKKIGNGHAIPTEKYLEELMRRPPRYALHSSCTLSNLCSLGLHLRLGVGAPIPESSVASRDTARLKNHLIGGKKRTRDESFDDKKIFLLSDDEEDSRANAVRKKSKPDPFAVSNSKKQSSQSFGLMTPRDTPTSSQAQLIDVTVPTPMVIDHSVDAPTQAAIASTRKKKRKKKRTDQAGTTSIVPLSPLLTPAHHDIQSKASVSESNDVPANAATASPTKETSLSTFNLLPVLRSL